MQHEIIQVLIRLLLSSPRKRPRNPKIVTPSRKPRPQRHARDTLHVSSYATHTAMTAPSGTITTGNTPASLADAQDAIPGLLDDIVVTHVLRSEHFDDPADLARLPAVSRAMRDAVAATGLRFEELTEDRAAELGSLSAVQRMQQGGCLSRQEVLCEAAARSGQLEKLKVLRADGCPWDAKTCENAAFGGYLKVLHWTHANGCPWDEQTCSVAAECGCLEVLQWARANGCPWDKFTCSCAAGGGHLEMLQWARENGCPWDEYTCSNAAGVGHLEVLQWAHTNGCPTDEGTCAGAAEGGNLKVLQWLRASGCPWSEFTCSNVAGGGHLEVLQWARANGCSWSKRTCLGAMEDGHVELLQWLRANGCRWTASTRGMAADLGYIESDCSLSDESADSFSADTDEDDDETSE